MRFIAITTAALLMSVSAQATDLNRRAQPVAPVVVAPAWGGFYGGIVAGYGWGGDVNGTGTVTDNNDKLLGSAGVDFGQMTGYSIGARFGYDFAIGAPLVIGVMTDAHYSNISGGGGTLTPLGSATVNGNIDWWGSTNLRVGFEPISGTPVLVYGLGGIAYGNTKFNGGVADVSLDGNAQNFGWDVGAGLGYMIAPKSEVFVEYRYVDLGDFGGSVTVPATCVTGTHTHPCTATGAVGGNANFSTILFGYNYHF